MAKRSVDVLVLSDVHLGTYGCHATELLEYLDQVDPRIIILNGDIIDIWNFHKYYWPEPHMAVIKKIMDLVGDGKQVYYLTGNHDELLRRFSGLKLGNFRLLDKLVLELDGQKCWFFHGDVFDVTMKYSKWLARLGAIGYDILILINSLVNFISCKLGRGKISLSKRVKDSVKSAVSFVDNFEETVTDIAIENEYQYVVCGHIHKPQIKTLEQEHGNCVYLNSGDWVENCTSLEYYNKSWHLYRHQPEIVQETSILLSYKVHAVVGSIASPSPIRELEVA